MPMVFPDIDALEIYVDTYIIANGNFEITGPQANNSFNGCIEFIRKSPLNYSKATYVSAGGNVIASTGVTVFSGATPTSLTWGDNVYNEWIFVNLTGNIIPLLGLLVYYDTTGTPIDHIPANTIIDVFKTSNNLWVQGNNLGGGTGSAQKQPKLYVVGSTVNAPTAGQSTWTLSTFQNSYIVLFLNSTLIDLSDGGDGSPYTTKTLGSDTLTITNYAWQSGDKLNYILITP